MLLGIAITTYNRLNILKDCLSRVHRYTTPPYHLFITDDGSHDGTREYITQEGLGRSYPNRGLAINRNRALAELFLVRGCSVAIILDDDALVTVDGWQEAWVKAAEEFGYVQFDYTERSSVVRWAREGAGHCSATSRECFRRVGYYDTRYSAGWGYEDADYARRAGVAFGWEEGLMPVLGGGVTGGGSGEFAEEGRMGRNRAIYLGGGR